MFPSYMNKKIVPRYDSEKIKQYITAGSRVLDKHYASNISTS